MSEGSYGSAHRPTSATNTSAPMRRSAGRSSLTSQLPASDGATADPTAGLMPGAGTELPAPLRTQLESSLGIDLSPVRVHTDRSSEDAAAEHGARAFTKGNDVHFGAGQYRPDDPYGQHLIAHEVTHTVQQRGAAAPRVQFKFLDDVASDYASDSDEKAADAAADTVTNGKLGATSDDINTIMKTQIGGAPTYWDKGAGPIASMTDAPDTAMMWTGAPEKLAGNSLLAGLEAAPAADADTPLGKLKGKSKPTTVDGRGIAWSAFTADWGSAQKSFASAGVLVKEYRTASADAIAKGLMDDSDGDGKNLAADAENATLTGTDVSVGKAFDDGGGLSAGDAWKAKKFDRKEALGLKDARAAAKKADNTLASKSEAVANKRTDLKSAGRTLQNVKIDADVKGAEDQEEAVKQNQQDMLSQRELVAKLVDAGFGILGAFQKGGEGAIDGAAAAIGALNSIDTHKAMKNLEDAARSLKTKASALKGIQSANAIANAAGALENAARDVKAAVRDFDDASHDRTKAYADLATSVGDLAGKAGVSQADAGKLTAAIQAIPLMEHVRDLTGQIAAAISVPTCNLESAWGCTMATTSSRAAMINHVQMLAATRDSMSATKAMWSKRIASVESFLNKMTKAK